MEKSGGARQRSAFSADNVEQTSDLLRLREAASRVDTPTSPGPARAQLLANPASADPDSTDQIRAAGEVSKQKPQTESAGTWTVSPGTLVVGRYEVLELVQHSGMGRVYKARDRQRERAGLEKPFVALKFASPASEDSIDTTSYLRQEFLKLSVLRHPNIVAAYDLDTHRGSDFIVLEWLQGETLAELLGRINSKRIALSKAQEIVASVAAALAHAHAASIVHGDIKPSNIFLTDEHAVKVLDFGSSGNSSAGEGERSWATRAYASCELLSSESAGPADDVFALGVTAYYLLSGERPYGELDALDAKEQGMQPEPLPEDAREHWPAIRAALQLDAADRPVDAGDFLARFEERPEAEPQEVFPRPIPVQRMAVAYGALAAVVIAVTVWWSIPGAQQSPSPVDDLLEKAAFALESDRLTGPGDDSALHYFRAVLAEDPSSAAASNGLDRIAETYLSGARTALAAEDFDGAVRSLAMAKDVQPSHFGIAAIEDLLARHRRDLLVSARQVSSSDIDQAQVYLTRAAMISQEDDADIESVRAELLQQARAADVDALMRRIDQRILSERLTMPAGDSAMDLYWQASRLAPDDRQVRLAADRIVTALLFQAMFAVSNGKLDDAEGFIEAAKSLEVRHLALARAEYELAKARHQTMLDGPSLPE
ncbi:MAG TPA: serine/threonine-protein kinase [Woeseiaceae bacterium]